MPPLKPVRMVVEDILTTIDQIDDALTRQEFEYAAATRMHLAEILDLTAMSDAELEALIREGDEPIERCITPQMEEVRDVVRKHYQGSLEEPILQALSIGLQLTEAMSPEDSATLTGN